MLKCEKLNCLIEARYTSVPFSKARQPLLGKGKTAEARRMPEFFFAGSAENICRTVAYALCYHDWADIRLVSKDRLPSFDSRCLHRLIFLGCKNGFKGVHNLKKNPGLQGMATRLITPLSS